MKKFVTKSVLFLLPFFLLLAATEAFVRHQPNTYRYKDQWLRTHGSAVQTLLLGNSHAYYDLVPSLVGDSVFNLSNVSQRVEHDFFLLQRYADYCPHLRRVIMVVDNSNLFDCAMEEDEPGRLTYYQLYMGYDKHAPFSRYGFELSSMISFKGKMTKWLKGERIDCDSLGWGKNYTLDRRPEDALDIVHVSPHQVKNWDDAVRNAREVIALARWCQQHDLQLVLLATPVCADYSRLLNPDQRCFLQQLYDECQHHYGARVLDYSTDSRFHDTDFFDPDHLSAPGARKFSVILHQKLF